MTSKERVRAALTHKQPDRVPANFEAVDSVIDSLKKHYGFDNNEKIYQKFDIDIRQISPDYIGPKLKTYTDTDGCKVVENYLGCHIKYVWTGKEYHSVVSYYPFDKFTSTAEVDSFNWPRADWFDYESLKHACDYYKDKALIIGHEGPFQLATFLRSMDNMFVDMAVDPELAHRIYDRLVEFELEFYERMFQASDGQIDILRPHDDYGTQISTLFSVDMWKEFFEDNTKKLVNLAHKYNAFYQQHSCGAIRPIIPELVKCGVDSLEPIQKVVGMDPKELKKEFGDVLCFHGGIDTQGLLPNGTPEEVKKEAKYFIDTLNVNGGYIFMASQGFESDVPVENIEAMYSVR
jgi:uroporphyrinogen decarboxylase